VNPYEAGPVAIRDEEQPGPTKNLRYALACEQFIGSFYILLLAMLFTGIKVVALDYFITAAGLFALPIGWFGLALGGLEFVSNRKGRLRSARAALVCGAGAIFPTWVVADSISNVLFH